MNDLLPQINTYQAIAVLLLGAVIAHFILSFGLRQLAKTAAKSANQLDDYLILAIGAPLKVFLWFGWFYFSITLLQTQITLLTKMLGYISLAPIFIITWGILRIITTIERYLLAKNSIINKDSVRLFARLIRILVIIIVFLGMAQFFGFSITSALTFGGVGGIVIGFAAKDMLSNIFGGLMIQLDKPFSTGDWIRSTEFEGTVEKIGWRMTRIRTFSKNPVYIPNSIFSTIPIETPSRMTNRRIREIIGIRYDDITELPKIISDIELMLKNRDGIDKSQAIRVYFNHFNASSLDFHIHAFTTATHKDAFQKLKQAVLLDIAMIIDKHKAQIAYPTQTLHIQK